jgi:hypothetical protein
LINQRSGTKIDFVGLHGTTREIKQFRVPAVKEKNFK